MAKDTQPAEPQQGVPAPALDDLSPSEPNVRDMLLEGQNVGDPEPDDTGGQTPEPDPPAEPVEPGQEPTGQKPDDVTKVEPPAAGEPSQFLGKLSELGFEDVGDDATGADRLLDAYIYSTNQMAAMQEQMRQAEQLAQYGQLYIQQQQQQQGVAPAGGQPAQQTPQGENESWWAPPKFDPMEAEKYRELKVDENGAPTIDWKADTPPEVKIAAEQHGKYVERWAEDLVQRPDKVLPPIIEREFNRLFEERWKAQTEQARVSQFASEVQKANSGWMYARDPRNNEVLYDQGGQPVLSQEGEQVMGFVDDAASNGVTDPEKQWTYAVAMFDYINNQSQQSQEQSRETSSEVASKKRADLQRRGARSRNRTGSVAPTEVEPERAQDPTLSPGEQLIQQLKTDGAEFV